ncbi:ubiquinol--cytochrome-c reductase subunit 8 [Mycoemilia scoparia]|uniref:Cytochrome b-c1 complex subunit 8 n=1 Tax=Mycoemilia scoparia TaxID=417184 RepID=A0A9W7ZZL2_9FUNG|nr:ubiquinol--cytochrome-c reductase subunit 8 [Mycoemilia scoparia]
MGGTPSGWWGAFPGPKVRGITTYMLSPYELKANHNLFAKGTFNMFRRVVRQLPYLVPAGLLYWGTLSYGKKKHDYLSSKAGHAEAEGH